MEAIQIHKYGISVVSAVLLDTPGHNWCRLMACHRLTREIALVPAMGSSAGRSDDHRRKLGGGTSEREP
jgi:hypothetical protein